MKFKVRIFCLFLSYPCHIGGSPSDIGEKRIVEALLRLRQLKESCYLWDKAEVGWE